MKTLEQRDSNCTRVSNCDAVKGYNKSGRSIIEQNLKAFILLVFGPCIGCSLQWRIQGYRGGGDFAASPRYIMSSQTHIVSTCSTQQSKHFTLYGFTSNDPTLLLSDIIDWQVFKLVIFHDWIKCSSLMMQTLLIQYDKQTN